MLLDWRRKIKERANQLKGLGDNSTETRVSFDDFLMAVVVPDDSSKRTTWMVKSGDTELLVRVSPRTTDTR